MTYYVKFSERTYEVSPPEEGDGDWLHQGDYGLDLTVMSVHASEVTGWGVQKFEVDGYDDIYGYDEAKAGDTVNLVVVVYTTGDTFGSHGTWTIPAIKKNADEALEAARKCNSNNYTPRAYRPWDGYFEHLDDVRVEAFLVSP